MSIMDMEVFLLTGINALILTGGVKNEQCIIEQKKQIVDEIADKLKLVNQRLLLIIVV